MARSNARKHSEKIRCDVEAGTGWEEQTREATHGKAAGRSCCTCVRFGDGRTRDVGRDRPFRIEVWTKAG